MAKRRRKTKIIAARYYPQQQEQLDPTDAQGEDINDPLGKFGCTAYSFAMGCDGATLGAVFVTGKWYRRHTDEPIPDPNSPGLNLKQGIRVAKKYLQIEWTDRSGSGWGEVLRTGRNGAYIVLQGDADQLPANMRCKPFDGPHAILVSRIYKKSDNNFGKARIQNPLCKTSVLIDLSVLRRYAEKLNPNVFFATSRNTPFLAKEVKVG